MTRVLVILVCLEVGLCLLILPWTQLWGMNLFAGLSQIEWLWPSGFFRGAISGLGCINIVIGMQEAYRFWRD